MGIKEEMVGSVVKEEEEEHMKASIKGMNENNEEDRYRNDRKSQR